MLGGSLKMLDDVKSWNGKKDFNFLAALFYEQNKITAFACFCGNTY